jgi:putative pantetheine hydrolase
MDYAGVPGPRNALTDVPGFRVGHAQLPGAAALSGTTVILAPPGSRTLAAVDVRGGGPGTRETDALDPRNAVSAIDAIVLTGGSAYGLSAADGAMAWLEEQGRGVPVSPLGHVVPVVPAAVIFDLGRGGDFAARPGPDTGRSAIEAAAASSPGAPVAQGNVGAGTGAVFGGMKGGVGTASIVLPDGVVVAALVVANAAGSAVDLRTGLPYGLFAGTPWTEPEALAGRPQPGSPAPEFPLLQPSPEARQSARRRLRAAVEARTLRVQPLNTTIGVVATTAAISRPQAQRLAGVAHDGMARAARPLHSLVDGDTTFAMSTGTTPLPHDPAAEVDAVNQVLAAGADVFTRAMVHAALAAESVTTTWGHMPSYRELYPSALGDEVR